MDFYLKKSGLTAFLRRRRTRFSFIKSSLIPSKISAVFIACLLAATTHVARADSLTTDVVNTSHRFLPAADCGNCHFTQFQQWSSSIMGYSSLSPVIHALELTENHTQRGNANANGFGRFARFTKDNSQLGTDQTTGPASELFCQKCHSPVAVFSDLFDNDSSYNSGNRGSIPDAHVQLLNIKNSMSPNDSRYDTVIAATEGVTCSVCHRINGINTDASPPLRPSFDPGVANSAYTYDDTLSRLYGPFSNPFGNNIGVRNSNFPQLGMNDGHLAGATQLTGSNGQIIPGNDGVERPFMKTGEFCGVCHDVRIPAQDAETLEPFRRVENLFTEWRNSPWNNNDNTENSLNNPQSGVYSNALKNPRAAALDLHDNPTGSTDTFTGNPLKQVTSCQDCHMSEFMIKPDAAPGEYQMGLVSTAFSTEERKISNHRFIGVDRILTQYEDVGDSRTTFAIDQNGNAILGSNNLPVRLSTGEIPDITEITSANKNFFPDLGVNNISGNDTFDARTVLLQKAVDFNIVSADMSANNQLDVVITAENVGAGHNIPAGLSQERQVWIELEILDRENQHVYTSGYMQPIEELESLPNEEFNPFGNIRYSDSESYCGANNGAKEYKCDLDNFRATLENNLEIIEYDPNGPDTQLVNYQNGFTQDDGNGGRTKAFSQFIGDSIDNNNSLKPFEKRTHKYEVNTLGHKGPFKVNARLRFRPLPHEFLAALKQDDDFSSSRVTDEVIEANRIIEMESDQCVSGAIGSSATRACNPVTPLTAGSNRTCSISPSGSAQCWGRGKHGLLGDGNTDDHRTGMPVNVIGLSDAKQISMGENHNCVLHNNGEVSCWGLGVAGSLGDGNLSSHSLGVPQKISPSQLSNVVMLASGYRHSCALIDTYEEDPNDGTVKCWGDGLRGALGLGHEQDLAVPTQIPQSQLGKVEMISARTRTTCILNSDGEVRCWGAGQNGQLGDGGSENSLVPKTVTGLNYAAKSIDVGANHACAILVNNDVMCWGLNSDGQVGDGTTSGTSIPPSKVVGLEGDTVTLLALGDQHSCALLDTGKVKCWGRGAFGATGNDVFDSGIAEEVTSVDNIAYIDAGDYHTCVKSFEGNNSCFGNGLFGMLGDNDITNHEEFDAVPVTPYISEDGETGTINLYNTGFEPWTRDKDGTTSFNTGPSTGANNSTYYYYMETSAGFADTFGRAATFESEAFDSSLIGANGSITFDYHMYGADIGRLTLQIGRNGIWTSTLWSRNGDQGNQWFSANVPIGNIQNTGIVKFRLRALANGGQSGNNYWLGDIAIDNIQLNLQ